MRRLKGTSVALLVSVGEKAGASTLRIGGQGIMRGWIYALVALLVVLAAPGMAQLPGMAESAKVVSASGALSVSGVKPGETVTAAVLLDIQSGWHVNANKPTLDYLKPTVVKLQAPAGLTTGAPRYPAPKSLSFDFSPGQPLPVFEGRTVVEFPLTVAAGTKTGTLTLKGSVAFQPCNDTACFPPTEKTFTLEVPVVEPDATVTQVNTDLFGGTASGGAAPGSGSNSYADALHSRGLLAFLAIVFIGGLLLNLTPCVYPMIAVTMAIFGARAGDPRGKVMSRALVYVLGMATMYTALGVFAALTGSLFGNALQSVWVKAGIALFLLVLALGMFGVYELQPPPRLAAALGGANRSGIFGLYFSGLVVGIFAAPCVGPVVLGLLALVGEKRDIAFGALSFFVLALGLGAPYILLASSTKLLTRLPRSGAWLEWTKHVFGVILVAVAVWYLVLALAPSVVTYVAPFSLILGALYLAFMDRSGGALPKFRAAKKTLGAVAIVAGIALGAGAWNAARVAEAALWPTYSDAALQSALTAGKPIVLDFSASWCAECRELEHKTFSDPGVQKALEPFTKLRVDLDGANIAQAEELQKRWKVSGLPAIVFVDESGNEVATARVGGFLPPDKFLGKVELAHPKVAARQRQADGATD